MIEVDNPPSIKEVENPPKWVQTTDGELISIDNDILQNMRDPFFNAFITDMVLRKVAGTRYRMVPSDLKSKGRYVKFSEIFKPGRMSVVMGELGSGKTTLLMIIASKAAELGYTVISNVRLQKKLSEQESKKHNGKKYVPVGSYKDYIFINNFADLIPVLAKTLRRRALHRLQQERQIDDSFEPILLVIDEWAQLADPMDQTSHKAKNIRSFVRYIRKWGVSILAASPNASDFASYYIGKRTKTTPVGEEAGGTVNMIFLKSPEYIQSIAPYHFETWGSDNLVLMTDKVSLLGKSDNYKLFVVQREGLAKHERYVQDGDVIFATEVASTFENGQFPDGTEFNMSDFLQYMGSQEVKTEPYEAMEMYVKKHSRKAPDNLTIDIHDPFMFPLFAKAVINAANEVEPRLLTEEKLTNTYLKKIYGGTPATWTKKVKKFQADRFEEAFKIMDEELKTRPKTGGRPRRKKTT